MEFVRWFQERRERIDFHTVQWFLHRTRLSRLPLGEHTLSPYGMSSVTFTSLHSATFVFRRKGEPCEFWLLGHGGTLRFAIDKDKDDDDDDDEEDEAEDDDNDDKKPSPPASPSTWITLTPSGSASSLRTSATPSLKKKRFKNSDFVFEGDFLRFLSFFMTILSTTPTTNPTFLEQAHSSARLLKRALSVRAYLHLLQNVRE